MTKKAVIQRILKEKIIAVLRLKKTDRIEDAVRAIVAGGISIIEITLNSENGLDTIHRIREAFPDCLVGAGTVIGYDASVAAVERGAKFLASPVTDLDMLAVANQIGVTSMVGALTPTEAWQASQAGADFVKLFPLAGLGAGYLKAIRGPLPEIRLIPTNGVSPTNVAEFLEAGAVAVGIGSSLISDLDLQKNDLSPISERARLAVEPVKNFG